MAADKIAEKIKAVGSKKAKVKKLQEAPNGTDSRKLDKGVKKKLEEAFSSVKLNNVQVHTGGNVADLGKAIRAKSFTQGNNIYFTKPADAKNKELLAHELTHVIQQGNGRMPKAHPKKALVSK